MRNNIWTNIKKAAGCYKEKLQRLLTNEKSVQTNENNEWAALINESYLGNKDTVQSLLVQGADVLAKSDYGMTALKMAKMRICSDKHEIVALLKEYGAKE